MFRSFLHFRSVSPLRSSNILSHTITNRFSANVENVEEDAAEIAAKIRKERVLVPYIFRERIKDGFGTYIYSDKHHVEDKKAYQEQIELSKKDISMLEFMEEGEDEETVSGRALIARYGSQALTEEDEKNKIIKQMKEGKDLTMEHPADIFIKVSDPNAFSFQECWDIAQHYEFDHFKVPGRAPLVHMLDLSRTRRHFLRTKAVFLKYDRKNQEWNHEDKIRIIKWCEKHRYPYPLFTNFKRNIATNFFNNRNIFERYMGSLLSFKKKNSVEKVLEEYKLKYGPLLTKNGYHYLINGFHKSGEHEKVIDLFKQLVFETKINNFSVSLWNKASKSMIVAEKLEDLEKIVEKLKQILSEQHNSDRINAGDRKSVV